MFNGNNNNAVVSMQQIQTRYQDSNQGHVFKFFDKLDDPQKEQLGKDLNEISLQELQGIYTRTAAHQSEKPQLQPFTNVSRYNNESEAERKQWESLGLQKISEGKCAVILLAGGQGTRLGTTNPKGMYDLDLPSHKSLYQIQAERLYKVQQLASEKTGRAQKEVVVPWYIMTSEATKPTTVKFFEDHSYWGLDKKNVYFFEQQMLPCITPQGKILMETPSKVSKAPNGNGGMYAALLREGVLQDLEKRGVEMVYIYGVDNCLIKMADPVFFGFSFNRKIDVAAKIVEKAYPEEPVGVLCINNGKPGVIEYSEIDKELAGKRDQQGNLLYGAAHICMNMFSTEFLHRVCHEYLNTLPYHIAKKKIPSVNDEGKTVTPDAVNGWKMELFIFDVFEFAQNMAALEVKRSEEFSPLKNGPKESTDCPQTCRQMLYQLHKSYLVSAGATISKEDLENASLPCEISPKVSYSGEGLESRVSGKSIQFPFHLEQ